jgi:hypothetical protein
MLSAMKLTQPKPNTKMKNTTTSATSSATSAATVATIEDGNKHIAAFAKAAEAYGKATGTFKSKTVQTVLALRAEGYDDKVITAALRSIVEKFGVSRQHLNRVLTAPAAEGGAGMEPERKHEKSGAKSVKAELGAAAAKGGVTVKIGDAHSLFAALLAEFEGKHAKIMVLAEKLNELASQGMEKAAKAAK